MALARRIRRLAAGLLAGAILVPGAGILLLHAPPARRWVFEQTARALQSEGIRLEAEGIDYNLPRLRLALRGVTLAARDRPDLPPLLRVAEIRVELRLWELVRGVYAVQSALADSPRIRLVVDAEGKDNLPRLAGRGGGGPAPEFVIERLRISGGSLQVEDRARGVTLTIPSWRLSADGDRQTFVHALALEALEEGGIAAGGRALKLRKLAARGRFGRDSLQIEPLEIELPEARLLLTGGIRDFAAPRLDAVLEGQAALDGLASFAGLKQRLEGELRLRLGIAGTVDAPRLEGTIGGGGLRFENLRGIGLAADFVYDGAAQTADLRSLRLSSPEVALVGSGRLALAPQAGQSALTARIDRADLDRLSRAFGLPVRVASRATAAAAASFPGLAFDKSRVRASFVLTPSGPAPAQDTLPVAGAIRARLDGGRAAVEIESLEALEARLQGELAVSPAGVLSGRLTAGIPLSRTLPALSRFQGETDAAPPMVSGEVELAAEIDGTVAEPRVLANISAPDVKAGTVEGIAAEGRLEYTPGRAVLEQASARWRGSTLTARGAAELTGARGLSFEANVDGAALRDLLEAAGLGVVPAAGTFSAAASVGGTLREPEAALTLAGRELALYGQPLGTLDAAAAYQGETIKLERLRLEKQPGQFVEASGSLGMGAKNYDFAARAENLQLREIVLPGGTPLALGLNLTAQGNGTLDNPAAHIELQAEEVRHGGTPFGGLRLSAELAEGRVSWKAAAPRFHLTASGSVGAAAPYPFEARIAARDTELPEPLKGAVSAVLTASGNAADPLDAAAEARIEPLALSIHNQPLKSEAPLTMHYSGRRLTLDPVTLVSRGSRLRLEGSVPIESGAEPGAVKFEGAFDLGELAQLAGNPELRAAGAAELSGTLAGNRERIEPEFTLSASNASLSVPGAGGVSGIELSVRLAGGELAGKLAASFASGRIESTATAPLGILPLDLPVEIPRAEGPARFTLLAEGLRLNALEAVPKEVAGTVSFRVDAEAPRAELDAVRGTARLTQLDLRAGEAPLKQDGEPLIRFENGVARIETFRLSGPGATLELSGTASLADGGKLALRAEGGFDASLASAFTKGLAADGPVKLRVAAEGPLDKPGIDGFLEAAGVNLSFENPRLAVEDLKARVTFNGSRAEIGGLEGLLNGGALSGGGFVEFAGGELGRVDLTARAEDVYLEFPAGVKTLSGAEIRVRGVQDRVVVGGKVEIAEGSYTDPITLERGLLRGLQAQEAAESSGDTNPLLKRTRLDVKIDTLNPLVIDNNLAKAGVNLDLRLVGEAARPGLTGRITLDEGGELTLSERRYFIERGVVTFTNERRIEPSLDILARTRVKDYDVSLVVQGGGGEPVETRLSSEPALPENDIVALLITGRTLTEAQAEGTDVAQEQVLSLLAGSLTGNISSQLRRVTGLSQVRVDPALIASEQNPTARLTVGQDVTKDLSLIYSMDLTNSSKQVYIAEYDLTRRFVTRGTRQEDDAYRFEFNHELLFGGEPRARRGLDPRVQRIVERVDFLGETPFAGPLLARRFGVKPGDRYDFFRVRRGLERLRELHTRADLLEARVRLERRDTGGGVALDVSLEAGPEVEFVYEGWSVPSRTRRRVREVWRGGVFDAQRIEEAAAAVRRALIEAGHLRAKIETSLATSGGEAKRVLFDITPGPRFRGVRVEFEGARSISGRELRGAIARARLKTEIYTDPRKVAGMLTRYYRERAFLDAEVGEPAFELEEGGGGGRVVFPVREGAEYRVGEVSIAGNRALKAREALEAARLETGAVFLPGRRDEALARLEEAYAEKGYLEAETGYSLVRRPNAGLVDVEFRVEENRPSVVESVNVGGNRHTGEGLIRTQTGLEAGEPVSFSGLSQARRNLYRTGAYSLVDLEREVLNPEGGGPKQVRLNVKVREVQPWQFRYGAYYDTDRGPGGIADVSIRNLLGSARVLGFRTRYDSDLREARAFFSQPLLRRFPLETIASTFYRRELQETFINDRVGVSLQQQARFGDRYVLNYGYRLERSHTYDREPDPLFPFDISLRVAPLTASLSRDTRDEILDATRGSFTSHALEWAPETLGSQLRFVRYFGQYFRYLPLARPREIPWSRAYKPRLVYAGGARVGLAGGLGGQELVPSERFYAGGGTSIRGFEQNFAGPLDFLGEPTGGDAVLIVNNELRFPLYSIFDGVAFLDLGNVYRRAADFSLSDVRKTGGFGVRARTPYFLLRLDYGMKLDRRTGESAGQLFFSIGQAF